jgi:N-acetylmuramoyl-L-alanine amidase
MRIVISSGHGAKVSGAADLLNEVTEARKVVERVASIIRDSDATAVVVFHENNATSQSANLNAITDFHNKQTRDLDVSVHFNSSGGTTDLPIGTETLYVTQEALAKKVSKAIADASGLIDRGAKKRTDLHFLNKTTKPAILIEVCFVNSKEDAKLYIEYFGKICGAITDSILGITSSPAICPTCKRPL